MKRFQNELDRSADKDKENFRLSTEKEERRESKRKKEEQKAMPTEKFVELKLNEDFENRK